MRGSRKFCQRGSNYDNVFLLLFLTDEGREEDPNATISGPLSASQLNADGGPRLNAGLVTL